MMHGELAVVDHPDGAGRNLGERLDHLGVDPVGIWAGNDVVTVNFVTAGGADTVDFSVADQNLLDLLVELILCALLLAFGLELHAHLMAEAAADVAAGEVVGHKESVNGKGQIVHAVSDVDPVRGQHLDGFFRKIEGVDDFRSGVADSLDKIGVLEKHLNLAHRGDGENVHAVVDPAAEEHELMHLVIGAGADFINFFGDGGVAVVIVMVKDLVDAGVRQSDTVALVDREPVHINAHVFKELTDLQALAGTADGHHLVQGGFDLKAVADKACS